MTQIIKFINFIDTIKLKNFIESSLKVFPLLIYGHSLLLSLDNKKYLNLFIMLLAIEFLVKIQKKFFSMILPPLIYKRPESCEKYTGFFLQRSTPENLQISKYGFPSGHAACMGVWFLWEWNNKPEFPIVIFIISLIVAFSRVYYKCHTLLQVIVGYGIGMLCIYLFETSFEIKFLK